MLFELFADTGAKERGPELGPSLMKVVDAHDLLSAFLEQPLHTADYDGSVRARFPGIT